MVCVPEYARRCPPIFLSKVAKEYHIRLYPSTLPLIAQVLYYREMVHKIETDDRPLVVTNIRRYDNTVRDFVSVRRKQYGDVADISSPTDIDVGEL